MEGGWEQGYDSHVTTIKQVMQKICYIFNNSDLKQVRQLG